LTPTTYTNCRSNAITICGDGLFSGYYWDAVPQKWLSQPFADNGGWPSSIFASQDQVAIDSVAYDFLLNEWPNVVTGGVGAGTHGVGKT
jgi:hypothetical protein